MLRWLASLTDSSPLGSVGGARKFAASLDRDIFSATDVVCAQLRAFISEAEHKETLAASPLLELDARLEATTTRLERDYLAASLQSHSLRERLWDSGYDWAMRFADAYRAILMRETASVAGRAATEFARVAARFFWFRTMAYRFRLYRHEDPKRKIAAPQPIPNAQPNSKFRRPHCRYSNVNITAIKCDR